VEQRRAAPQTAGSCSSSSACRGDDYGCKAQQVPRYNTLHAVQVFACSLLALSCLQPLQQQLVALIYT
jgi:hypothetical protein